MKRCAIYDTVKLIGKKWTLLIIFEIYRNDNPSFNQLKRKVKNITSKMLSQRLIELENNKIVYKKTKKNPFRSYFYLTAKEEDLVKLFNVMKDWHNKWIDKEKCTSFCKECKF